MNPIPRHTADVSLGRCCVCETTEGVVNIIALDLRVPLTPGTRPSGTWGCVVCDLPAEGAVAVVCDACLEQPLKFACVGYPYLNRRVPVERLTEPFTHDLSKHPETAWRLE
ncbi:MAG: hypothetical protein M3458_20805 [Acidobacteriota bacterium]|nr:hypothetical protein [Acidobacteriota bacterium]